LLTFDLLQLKIIMQQSYHSNAVTNVHIRTLIQKDLFSSNEELANQFGTSEQTVSKWKNRNFTNDASSAPLNIVYALSEVETALAVSIRSFSWLPLDEVFEVLLGENPEVSRSSVYRCFVKYNINKVPVVEREKAK
jgi:hypothetical protein